MIDTTIDQLRQAIGMGIRKNKYLVQIPLSNPTGSGKLLNILCQATSLPERSNSSVSIFMAGRKYNVRGETEFPGTYDITVVDDKNATLRKEFDKWLNSVDNTSKGQQHISGEGKANVETFTETELTTYESKYQHDVKIWQLDMFGNKIYGYVLQNCFPTSLGAIELGDASDSGLSEFSVSLTYSEMIPIISTEITESESSKFTPLSLNSSSNSYAPDRDFSNDYLNSNKTNRILLPTEAYPQLPDNSGDLGSLK